MSTFLIASAPKNEEINESFQCSVTIVVPGVPKKLYYSLSLDQNVMDIGWEVLVEVGSRKVKGWVIEKQYGALPTEELLSKTKKTTKKQRTLRRTTAKDRNLHQNEGSQLVLFPSLFFVDEPKVSHPLLQTTKPFKLKPVLFGSCAFDPDELKLFIWMAEYYGTSLAEVIDNAVPKRGIGKQKRKTRLDPDGTSHPADHSQNIETAARRKGLFLFGETPGPPVLTADQSNAVQNVVSAIDSKQFSSFLLFGVTGSGKTEVYLQAIEHVLESGGSALVLVPEIALTPQLIDQFASRLTIPLALLHSQVGEAERLRSWDAILRGTIRIAIGARSAVFAPLQDLRLIIVDEEHENSYKQSDNLRYHARDVAVMRAKFARATVILGSATPSFESLRNVQRQKYRLIEMPCRATARPQPQLEIVELNQIKRKDMPSENISPQLFRALKETLERNGQGIILYNRRGFSNYLQCETCTEVVQCPNCAVTLTYHKRAHSLICHYCSFRMPAPEHCTFCRNPRTSVPLFHERGNSVENEKVRNQVGLLAHRGAGTERIVEELSSLFPTALIARLDRDVVTKRDAYRRILGEMRTRQTDILVGTQMIAKGHDLPGVTVVGIINADVGLHMPDFRSSEKVFQLITQAAGRAGRGQTAGRVILQTREPQHPTIVASATGRFLAFARYELEYRKELSYPPWSRMLRLIISCTNSLDVVNAAQIVQEEILVWTRQASSGRTDRRLEHAIEQTPLLSILGPAPAPHQKLRNRYRWHLLVKSSSSKIVSELAAYLNHWKKSIKQFENFRLGIDVDPVDMM